MHLYQVQLQNYMDPYSRLVRHGKKEKQQRLMTGIMGFGGGIYGYEIFGFSDF